MKCPVCGFTDPQDPAIAVCPRCSLLQAIGLSGGGEEPADPPLAHSPESASEPAAPQVPGYELIRSIGRGAMGSVWLARELRLDRLVALKLIATGADPVLAERLLREGRAAARLSHPHIVAVYALGGASAAAFLAMEFVEGGNLAEYLRGQAMPPKAAALLVAKLAGALAHAHAAGVLHRDLKPSNVLLNAAGEPLLADFGLAAPVDGRGDLTRLGEFGGTPAFVAPELFEGPDRASPQSDLYSLGVVLYIAITGRPPFVADSAGALLRAIASDEPPPPRVLQPSIPRDLETIVLKCLEKAPGRRYGSAAALQIELGRFLAGEPIVARPISPAGRLVRWCGRRPAAAAALTLGAFVLLLLAGGGPLVAWKLERSRRAAAESAATATAIADFLQTDLLAQASPDHQAVRDLKLRTVVDQAAAKVGTRFADRPLVEAAVRETLGETYLALGEFGSAQEHFERALALRLPGGGNPATKDARVSMNALASALYFQGKTTDASALFARVVHSGAPSTREDTTVCQALGNWGMMCQKEGRYAQGAELIAQAWVISQRVVGPEHPETLVLMNNLVACSLLEGDYAGAADLETKLLAIRTRVSGPDHPDTVTVMANLAFIERQRRRFTQAESYALQALAVRQRVSGLEHIYTLIAMADLAQVYKGEGRLTEAEELARRATEIALRTLGPSHPQVLSLAGQWGEILLLMHRPAEAEQVLRKALEGRSQSSAPDWRTYIAESRRGEALTALGRYAEAAPVLTASYAGLQQDQAKIPIWSRDELTLAQQRLVQLQRLGATAEGK